MKLYQLTDILHDVKMSTALAHNRLAIMKKSISASMVDNPQELAVAQLYDEITQSLMNTTKTIESLIALAEALKPEQKPKFFKFTDGEMVSISAEEYDQEFAEREGKAYNMTPSYLTTEAE